MDFVPKLPYRMGEGVNKSAAISVHGGATALKSALHTKNTSYLPFTVVPVCNKAALLKFSAICVPTLAHPSCQLPNKVSRNRSWFVQESLCLGFITLVSGFCGCFESW